MFIIKLMLIIICIQINNTKIKNLILYLKYNLDSFFTITFIEKNKNRKFSSKKVEKNIVLYYLINFLSSLIMKKKMLSNNYSKSIILLKKKK